MNVTITAPWERPWPILETDSYVILSSFSGKMDGTLEGIGPLSGFTAGQGAKECGTSF